MKVFLLAKKERVGPIDSHLAENDGVLWLQRGDKDFPLLLGDSGIKIIGIDPGLTGWRLPADIIEGCQNLTGICSRSAWTGYIDLNLCGKKGIAVCNTPEANSQSVAEYAIWQMFCLAKKLPLQIADKFKVVHDHEHLHCECHQKIMGIMGLGNIGKRIARMGEGLGMEVIYWSRSYKDASFTRKTLEDLLGAADFIFNCVEISEETRGLLNKDLLALMKPTSYYISVLGGMGWGVEDSNFLIRMVKGGKLAGYGVENKHHKNFRVLSARGNVFYPGAYAYYTHEAIERVNTRWVEAINGLIQNNPAHRVV